MAWVTTGVTASRKTAIKIALSPTSENDSLTTTAAAIRTAPKVAGEP